MRRTFAGFMPPLLAALALLSRGSAVAGPPDGVSGKLVLDEVTEGVRQCRREKDPEKRLVMLKKLAPSHDPRVAVAIGEILEKGMLEGDKPVCGSAADMLLKNFPVPPDPFTWAPHVANGWWLDHKADLRRRAAQLPR